MSTSLRRFSGRDAAVAAAWVAAGAIGATALTGIAFAAGDTATPSPTAPSTSAGAEEGPRGPGEGMGMGMGRGPGHGLGAPLGRVQHGDLTVTNKDGDAELVRVQSGEVTAVSDTSITVKSDDGYTATWTINSDTKIHRDREDATAADIKVGDTARLGGPLSGDTATARHIGALSPEAAAEAEQRREEREALREQNQDQDSNSSSSTSLAEYVI